MTDQCFHQPARFRGLGDYRPGERTAALLRRARAAIDMADLWLARSRRRRTLTEIAGWGERTILDLGFDPDELRLEASKPFWQE